MKFLHYLFGTVLFISLLLLGGYVIYAAVDAALWKQTLDMLIQQRVLAIGAGAALLLLVVIYLLSGCCRRKKSAEFLSFENESGAVSISMSAISDFLGRIGNEFAAVLSMEPSIRAVSGAVEVTLDVKVKAGAQIPELCRMLQERVKESITANLGLSDIKGVRVNVQEIVASPASQTSKGDSQG